MSGPLQWSPQGMVPAIGGEPGSGAITPGVVAQPSQDDDEDDEAPRAPRVVPEAARMHARKPAPRAAVTPRDVLKLARARLREVETEIRRLTRLTKERDQLRRLLEAASAKPRAVVRELPKRSAG